MTGIEPLGHENIVPVVLPHEVEVIATLQQNSQDASAGLTHEKIIAASGPALPMNLRLPTRYNLLAGAPLNLRMETTELHLFYRRRHGDNKRETS